MLYFRSLISKGEGEVIIFWTEFNANGITSWLIFIGLILGGIFLSKKRIILVLFKDRLLFLGNEPTIVSFDLIPFKFKYLFNDIFLVSWVS